MTWEECIVRFLLSWSALDVQSTTAQASGPALSSSSSSPPSLRERFRLLIWCVSSYQESIVLQVILNLLRQEGVDRSHGMNYYCANGWHIRYFAFNSVLYVVEALCVSAHVEYDGLFPFRPRSMWCLVFFLKWYLSCGTASYCIAWHDIWSYVANLWLRLYRYNIIYRCSFIPCWVRRQEFMCIYMHFCMV
jgi:hypothetical protein